MIGLIVKSPPPSRDAAECPPAAATRHGHGHAEPWERAPSTAPGYGGHGAATAGAAWGVAESSPTATRPWCLQPMAESVKHIDRCLTTVSIIVLSVRISSVAMIDSMSHYTLLSNHTGT